MTQRRGLKAHAPRGQKVRPDTANEVKSPKTPSRRKREVTSTQPAGRDVRGREPTKTRICIDLLRRADGASIQELQAATGWQAHSVRGFLAGTVKKKLRLELRSEKSTDGDRRYRAG